MSGAVDLHLHTNVSDGVLTPAELVHLAQRRKLSTIAITDHDTTDGVAEALAAATGSELEVIPGVEISTDVPRGEVHILGYFVDWGQKAFQQTLALLRRSRYGRARKMVGKLAELGVPVPWERVLELAGPGAVGRPHLAQAMVERGHVATVSEAFRLYLGRNGPAYVERYKLTPTEAVRLVLEAQGLPALAHPVLLSVGDALGEQPNLEALVPELVESGLVGLEAYYPEYTAAITQRLLALARRWRLVTVGGTDYHGRGHLVWEPGSVLVPEKCVKELKARLPEPTRA